MLDLIIISVSFCSFAEESESAVSYVGEHFVKLLLSVESVILSKGGVIVSDMLPYFIIKSSSDWRDYDYNSSDSCEDVFNFEHFI